MNRRRAPDGEQPAMEKKFEERKRTGTGCCYQGRASCAAMAATLSLQPRSKGFLMQALPHGATPAGLEPASCPVPLPQQEQEAQASDASMMPTLHSVWNATRNFLLNAEQALRRSEDFSHIVFSGGLSLMQNAAQRAGMMSSTVEAMTQGVVASSATFYVARHLVTVTRAPHMAGMAQQAPVPEPTDPKQ